MSLAGMSEPGLMGTFLPHISSDDMSLVVKAIASYMGYFGSRFVGNDIQLMCGNLLDTSVGKTFTLYCIMLQATSFNYKFALYATLVCLLGQYLASLYSQCRPYRDKTDKTKSLNIMNTIWPTEKGVNELNIKPGTVKY